MKIDTVRGVIVNITASAVIVMSIGMLYALTVAKLISGDAALAILTTILGSALTFLFGNEQATRAVKSFQAGVNTPTPGNGGTTVNTETATVQGGNPTNVITTDKS